MGFLDVIFIIAVFVLAQSTITFFSRDKGLKCKKDLQNLWLYHLLFGVIYMVYTLNFGGDALNYWSKDSFPYGNTLEIYIEHGAGTAFIHLLNYPFVHVMELSYFTGAMMYAFVGFLGILFFYLATRTLVEHNVKVLGYNLFPLIFFLPNLHFWSAGVGKDTLCFFGIGLFVYSALNIKSRILGVVCSLFLLYYVRPHVAMFLLASFGIGTLFDRKLKMGYKFVLTAGFVLVTFLLLDSVMEYVKLDEVSTESVDHLSNKHINLLSDSSTGSGVDMGSYPLPLKIFTFLFRPLFFDAHNVSSLISSVDNLILLYLTYILFSRSKPFKAFSISPYIIKALVIFLILGTIGFSISLGNTGIMVRMKNMFTPALLIFILYTLSLQKSLFLAKHRPKVI
jgi:hypothetical protein